ncbi:MAG: M15 family metallopeptidase [Actinomycetes bacterium]
MALLSALLALAAASGMATTPAAAVGTPIDARWNELGGAAGVLGPPIADEHDVAGVSGARAREFTHGHIYFSDASGAWDAEDPILARYLELGGASGSLGLPVAAAAAPATRPDARRQPFQGGELFASASTGTRMLTGPVLAAYTGTAGGPDGSLGLPTGEETATSGGSVTVFENGRIYASAATGAHVIPAGTFLDRYLALGGAPSYLGFPTSEVTDVPGGRQQTYQWGTISLLAASGSMRVSAVWRTSVARVSAAEIPYTYRPGCPVSPVSLRRVRLPYADWAGNPRMGNLIARSTVVSDLTAVFKRAFQARFPIRRMDPVDVWKGSDVRAMAADNTSAFNCRKVTGNPYRLSQHAYGNAIDINTLENPYVTKKRVYPSAGKAFLKRNAARKGMLMRRGPIAREMARQGWPWGARWSHPDYQHFSSNGG